MNLRKCYETFTKPFVTTALGGQPHNMLHWVKILWFLSFLSLFLFGLCHVGYVPCLQCLTVRLVFINWKCQIGSADISNRIKWLFFVVVVVGAIHNAATSGRRSWYGSRVVGV